MIRSMYLLALTLVILSINLVNGHFGESRTFYLTDEPIDVVIPAVEPGLVDLCIEGIRKYGENIRNVYVVSPTKVTDNAIWIDEHSFPFSIKTVVQHLFQDEAKADAYLQKYGKGKSGWYLQQLLKFYAPLVIPNISSNVLILDSDVIFLAPVQFLNNYNEPLFCPSTDYWVGYFNHAGRLLPGFRRVLAGETWGSGISHHMLMQRDPIKQLLELIESIHGVPAWQAICHCVEVAPADTDLPFIGCSEFEIYFNFILASGNQWQIRPLKWENAQGLFNWEIPAEKMSGIQKFQKNGYVYIAKHF